MSRREYHNKYYAENRETLVEARRKRESRKKRFHELVEELASIETLAEAEFLNELIEEGHDADKLKRCYFEMRKQLGFVFTQAPKVAVRKALLERV